MTHRLSRRSATARPRHEEDGQCDRRSALRSESELAALCRASELPGQLKSADMANYSSARLGPTRSVGRMPPSVRRMSTVVEIHRDWSRASAVRVLDGTVGLPALGLDAPARSIDLQRRLAMAVHDARLHRGAAKAHRVSVSPLVMRGVQRRRPSSRRRPCALASSVPCASGGMLGSVADSVAVGDGAALLVGSPGSAEDSSSVQPARPSRGTHRSAASPRRTSICHAFPERAPAGATTTVGNSCLAEKAQPRICGEPTVTTRRPRQLTTPRPTHHNARLGGPQPTARRTTTHGSATHHNTRFGGIGTFAAKCRKRPRRDISLETFGHQARPAGLGRASQGDPHDQPQPARIRRGSPVRRCRRGRGRRRRHRRQVHPRPEQHRRRHHHPDRQARLGPVPALDRRPGTQGQQHPPGPATSTPTASTASAPPRSPGRRPRPAPSTSPASWSTSTRTAWTTRSSRRPRARPGRS